MRIAIGSDHAGFKLKAIIEQRFNTSVREFTDFGVNTPQSVDYPDIAAAVGEAVARGDFDLGILICGTGIGMAIAANKVPGIRAALCHDVFTATAAREHNNANILTLGERVLQPDLACEIVDAWLQACFVGGRHARRLEKIRELEKKYIQPVAGFGGGEQSSAEAQIRPMGNRAFV
jgi:ribose 5-phosphate isomerase B